MTGASSRRQVASLVRLATDRLAGLGMPPVFTLAQLCERVEEHRARPIQLISRELPAAAPHGLWIAGEHADYIFYDCTVGPVRQHQIIGHELGHMLFDDAATSTDPGELVSLMAPGVDPATLRNLQQRTGYELLTERRAEVFGSVVVQRTESWAGLPHHRIGSGPPARLVAALEGDPRR